MKKKAITFGILFLLLTATNFCKTNTDDGLEDEINLLAILMNLPGAWEKHTPTSGNISIDINGASTRNFDFNPTCSGLEGTDSTYSFFVKKGTSKNVLINFMGGGACWDGQNCLGHKDTLTYYPELGSINMANLAIASSQVDAGVLNHNKAENPFKDWTMVLIPYCTGDMQTGSREKTYTNPITGASEVIKHRGFDNVLSVLKHLQTNYKSADVGRVAVVGQSGGGLAAVANFAYVKEMYYDNQVDLVNDANFGVTVGSFNQTTMDNWGMATSLPDWVPGIDTATFGTSTPAEFIKALAEYYTTSRMAQYTTAYDDVQRYFFNVTRLMDAGKAYVADISMWGRYDATDMDPALTCQWYAARDAFISKAHETSAGNYRSYVAPGVRHTISMYNEFYTTTSNGVTLVDFFNQMLTGSDADWQNVTCVDCQPPAGVNCD